MSRSLCNMEMKILGSSRYSMELKVNAAIIMKHGDEGN